MTYTIGLDIGGTKTASVLTDQQGTIHHRVEVPSDTSGREKMFESIVKCIELLMEESSVPFHQLKGIGVGVPGKVDSAQGVAIYQNNLPWTNFPLEERLREKFPITNIIIDNDVHMAAFGEWKLYANNVKTFVYMTISTGISCAIIHNGVFLRGNGFAGEVGLIPVHTHGSENQINRLEQAASGVAIENAGKEKFQTDRITTRSVFELYFKGNKEAEEIISTAAKSISYGLYSIISLLDPERIAIGGGVINHQPSFMNDLKKELKQHIIKEQTSAINTLEKSGLKDNAGCVGAALRVYYNVEKRKQGACFK